MILITGATGLVGSHLLYRFRESAKNIKALYRNEKSIEKTRLVFSSYSAGDEKLVDDFIWEKCDILDLPRLEKVIKGVKTVYHCAASLDSDNFEKIKEINVTGTANVINIALLHGVKKLCHVSSIAALGEPVGERLINEDDYFNLDKRNTDYAISKYGAEMEAWRANQEGLPTVIVNPGVILGEGDWNTGSGQIFLKTYRGNRFYTAGCSGFVDVRDVVAIMQNLTESDVSNQRFILVSENASFKNVLSLAAESLGKAPPKIRLNQWFLKSISVLSWPARALGWVKGLSLAQVDTYTSKTKYSNEAITELLDYKFIPLQKTILRVGQFYKSSAK
jgi:nucleoside-diphosphate-sugar epimerase